jgi:UDP-N-acetylglucosamine 2-epimerase (non-hydrolysing)
MAQPLVMVLGIRPDVIRASIMIRELRVQLGSQFILVWSGQHYSDNLKDVFFRELGVGAPDIELGISGSSDAELVASMIVELSKVLEKINPSAVVFLGDTNTVMGTVAAGQLNIPVIHIEGCMRSYDWRMPEEKYRTIADHLSDRIYAYLDEYKAQGIAEGIPGENILVTGNPIVDVLQEYFISGKLRMAEAEFNQLLFDKYQLTDDRFLVMTCHRRENIESEKALQRILLLAEATEKPVLFPAGYRTQRMIKDFGLALPKNVQMVDPIGYLELLELLVASVGVLTDSGTIVEEAAVLGVPSIQMRTATERPEVYIFKASVRFDPHAEQDSSISLNAFAEICDSNWEHTFGDGRASYRIVDNLVQLLMQDGFSGHQMEKYLPYSARSFMS